MELNNIQESKNIIELIEEASIAEELEIEKGDILLSINGQNIRDIIDYKFHMSDDYVVVVIQKKDGQIWELEIEKDYDEDIGIVFTNPLIDRAKSCRNRCLFCFIDQLPKGMRDTLYFKDDDSRLSFLQGNFITLTNMSENEIERIIKYRISPINISVHTTDPQLRIKMLNNKNAGKLYDILKRFHKADIQMNCQIVLCPGINDGENLDKTLNDLAKLYPSVASVAVVPVGLTKYRKGLFELDVFDYKLANELLMQILERQKYYQNEINTRFVFASDEFYVVAKKDVPSYEEYEGFPQIENGVGLMRKFSDEIKTSLNELEDDLIIDKSYIIATGTSAKDFMEDICEMTMKKFKSLELKVVPIKNIYFGETITVAGLITGGDLIEHLKQHDIDIKDGIIIPKSMLKSGEEVFLDDTTLKDVENELNTKVIVSDVSGNEFTNIFYEDERC